MSRDLQKHFPTLFVALPRAARSVPGTFLAVARRLRRTITPRTMAAATAVGLVLGAVGLRALRFSALADYHSSQVVGVRRGNVMRAADRMCRVLWFDARSRLVSPQQVVKDQWHRQLTAKYRDAAARPWLPVEPDPPPPQP